MGAPGAPGPGGPTVTARAPTMAATTPGNGQQGADLTSETSTTVRSRFPETWIWTEAMTGYVVVACHHDRYYSKIVCIYLFIYFVDMLIR